MPGTPRTLSLMLVDDHEVVRAGYRRFLELDPLLTVAAEAATGEQAYELLRTLAVDVVVMDLSMPGQGGFETMRRMLARHPGLKIVVFTMHESPAMAQQALQMGAAGYLTKSMPPEDMVRAIHKAIAGERPVAASLAIDEYRARGNALHDDLLPREFEVLNLMVQGHDPDGIAQRLHISERTAANYATSVRKKLGCSSIFELRRYAELHGLPLA